MPTLWLRHEYVRRDGRPGRDYTIHDGDGTVRFAARASRVPGPIAVFQPGDSELPLVRGRPRRSFPLTGRYDVIAPPDTRIGVATRSGRFFAADGRKLGRFRDARSLKRGIGEGVAVAVLEGLIGGDGAGSGEGVGASAFLVQLEGLPTGRLTRQRLPFITDDVRERAASPGRAERLLRRLLPRRAGDRLLERRPRHGWLLDVPDSGDVPEMLLLTAALLAIEIALW